MICYFMLNVVHISVTRIINTVNDGLSRGNDLGVMMRAMNPIEHFFKVFLPLTKTRKVPKEAPMEHPRLPELPILETLASDVSNYYIEQAATDNELILKALREREKDTQMGIWDWAKYMNEVNCPEKKLKQGYHIEIFFLYPDVDEENRYMWCCKIVTRVK